MTKTPPSGRQPLLGGGLYDYIAGLVYDNNSLEFIPTAEGRALPPAKAVNPEPLPGATTALSNAFYRYEYQLKDHLGNLRAACRCAEIANPTSPKDSYAPIAVQENHYDAWGLALPLTEQSANLVGSPEHRWQYNGKEKVPDLNWYEYGFRWYAPDRARFLQVDPLADEEDQEVVSPFTYVFNNSVNLTDPLGLCPECESLHKSPYEGQVHLSSGGGIYFYTKGTWTREDGYLNEVTITPTNDDKDKQGSSVAIPIPQLGLGVLQKSVGLASILINLGLNFTGDVSTSHRNRHNNLPIYFVPQVITPNIYNNTMFALTGDWQTPILTYGNYTEAEKRAKRQQAYGYRGPADPSGQGRFQWDEYPFASTFEGGRGATVRRVPAWENRIQGIMLNKFYRRFNLRRGSKFIVIPISNKLLNNE